MSIISSFLLLLSSVLALLVLVFAIEAFASCISLSTRDQVKSARIGTVAVLVPAHNEALTLRPTLDALLKQLATGDRLIVVADNCTDDSAAVARAAGAEVVERLDLNRRGKGFALEYGLSHLSNAPPETVIIVDADCFAAPGAIATLAEWSQRLERPIQAEYIMQPPVTPSVDYGLATFAWRVKNSLRPRGLKNLGFPCQLTGTGMAFPWEVITRAEVGTGAIVEDLKLGLELAEARRAPLFCPSALVTSYFPETEAGAQTQRERWEGGHLNLIATVAAPALAKSVAHRNRDLFVLALDLAVPPLTLLAFALAAVTIMAAAAVALGLSAVPLLICALGLSVFSLGIVIAWHSAGRDVLPLARLRALPAFLGQKLRLYTRITRGRRQTEWVRTERGTDQSRPRGSVPPEANGGDV